MLYLGNLTITEFEKRTGYKFNKEDKLWLEQHRQDDSNITYSSEKLHIFDIPFSIHASELIYSQLFKLLQKYESISKSKEILQLLCIKESEEKKNTLEKHAYEEKLQNPNSIWNIKWHMLVPINDQYYYGCFINTYTTGRNNIPNIIHGYGNIRMDDNGLQGKFYLDYPEIESDADERNDWNYIIGTGIYDIHGNYLHKKINFEEIRFNIKDAIRLYTDLIRNSKEIHFFKYKAE